MTSTPKCHEEVSVQLTGRDLWVTRLGLKTLLASSTRHEHIYHDIHAALAKLPEAHEPDAEGCACAPGAVNEGTGQPNAEARRASR